MIVRYVEAPIQSMADDDPRTVARPQLPVRVAGPQGSAKLRMLVESGADETLLPLSVLRYVGARITDERFTLQGVGGASVVGYVAEARLEIVGRERSVFSYQSRVVGVSDEPRQPPILGHRDFFLNFRVCFDSRARRLEFTKLR